MKENAGHVLQDLLKKEFPETDVWVPGIASGAMASVIVLLNELSDAGVVRVIRQAAGKTVRLAGKAYGEEDAKEYGVFPSVAAAKAAVKNLAGEEPRWVSDEDGGLVAIVHTKDRDTVLFTIK